MIARLVEKMQYSWYRPEFKSIILWLLMTVYVFFVGLRKSLYRHKILTCYEFDVPIIIVGNITVGGTGKTPTVIYLVELLKKHGFNPGVVSRGYKGRSKQICPVTPQTDPLWVGDEPVQIAKRANCPVVVGRNRVKAVDYLLNNFSVNVVICDDGLQHYALARHIEIAVIDGNRRFGNGFCLPLGPLRESLSRLDSVDLLLTNGGLAQDGEFSLNLYASKIYNICYPKREYLLEEIPFKTVHAVAGIGNPEQFFTYLKSLGLNIIPHVFPDHYRFESFDLCFKDPYPIIMTEKDAVKCRKFATMNFWCMPVDAKVDPKFEQALLKLLGG